MPDMHTMNTAATKRIGSNKMDEEMINELCRDIASETMTKEAEAYADDVDYEWLRQMQLANPRFFGPDFDEEI